MASYIEVARTLSLPTEEQTRAFAEFVTGAHSWYKHLRIHPPSPFVFFLDPNAGRAMVHVSEDSVAFIDNTDESQKFHYTWQTTESYRKRFGFWTYEAPYGRSFIYRSADGVVDTSGAGLHILSEDGEWLAIPEHLMQCGTALLTALMWVMDESEGEYMNRVNVIFSVVNPLGRTLGQDLQSGWLRDDLPHMPDNVQKSLRALLRLWQADAYQREMTETWQAYDDAPLFGPEWDEIHARTRDAWKATASRARERVLLEPLRAALEEERQRQIEAMVAAMNRFVAVLHDAGERG